MKLGSCPAGVAFRNTIFVFTNASNASVASFSSKPYPLMAYDIILFLSKRSFFMFLNSSIEFRIIRFLISVYTSKLLANEP